MSLTVSELFGPKVGKHFVLISGKKKNGKWGNSSGIFYVLKDLSRYTLSMIVSSISTLN